MKNIIRSTRSTFLIAALVVGFGRYFFSPINDAMTVG
jgi:hypothetical protein